MKKDEVPLHLLSQIFTGIDTRMIAEGWEDYTDTCDSEWAGRFHCFDCNAPLEYVRYGRNNNHNNQNNKPHEQTQLVYCPDCSACYGIIEDSDMPVRQFGLWKAYRSGIEYNGNYFLEYCRFSEDDWLKHLRQKTWWDSDCENDFVQAWECCKRFNNVPSVKQYRKVF